MTNELTLLAHWPDRQKPNRVSLVKFSYVALNAPLLLVERQSAEWQCSGYWGVYIDRAGQPAATQRHPLASRLLRHWSRYALFRHQNSMLCTEIPFRFMTGFHLKVRLWYCSRDISDIRTGGLSLDFLNSWFLESEITNQSRSIS